MLDNFGLDNLTKLLKILLGGTGITLQVFLLTLLFAVPLGLFVAIGRMSQRRWIREPIKLYVLIMRGTPLILQLIFVYFAPTYMFQGMVNLDRFTAAIIAFTLNYAAYFSEIYRGGIESISREQYEAAAVLGFTKVQTFIKIILPQVIKRILPASSNEVITLVKDTALVQVIGVAELFREASKAASREFTTTPIFIAGLFYLVMNWGVTKVFHIIEKKLNYYR